MAKWKISGIGSSVKIIEADRFTVNTQTAMFTTGAGSSEKLVGAVVLAPGIYIRAADADSNTAD